MSQNKNNTPKNPRQNSEEEKGDLYEIRLEKLNTLIQGGNSPYLASFHKEQEISALIETAKKNPSLGEIEETVFSVAGRIRSKRLMGKAAFMDLEDENGKIQIYGAKKILGDSFENLKSLDLGDIIGVKGTLFRTKTGQLSVRVKEFLLLAKCLRPLPVVKEKEGVVYDAFVDKEQRYRMRYVDLIVNKESKEKFLVRSKIISYIRRFLENEGFLEVETPMMHPIPGGASARPFITHHNTLDMDLYLRIAPELYLKRLLVGGFSKVFELNRNFRNEGISYKHNPEFTMLELYAAYENMESMLKRCERLISGAAKEILGKTKISYGERDIDLTPPWERLTYLDSIKKYAGVELTKEMSLEEAKNAAKKCSLKDEDINECKTVWKIAELIFDEKVEPKLIQPVFITMFPKELSPLAKISKENPDFVERFEPYIVGREMGNAFSELNDPLDQKARFEEQVKQREAGDEEGGYMDTDYIRALEYGMPPAGGMGIGIDRLVMLLTDSHNIKDTILFPLLRPEKQ